MAKAARSRGAMKTAYHNLLVAGARRLSPDAEAPPDALAALVEEYRAQRAAGEPVSIRRFCGEHRLSQKQFEARLRLDLAAAIGTAPPATLGYYQRADVQDALFLWAQGRRLTTHYANGAVRLGFRRPDDIAVIAAAADTQAPTFHASVGRYSGHQLQAFDLVAEVDFKGDWRQCFRITRPLIDALHDAGVEFLVKFSGHSSAHVIVPCRGADFAHAVQAFLSRLPPSLKGCGRFDLSFRHPQHFLRMPYALHERTGLRPASRRARI